MKRLRLIKPWRLRAVHQRLAEVSFNEDILVPCRGPVSCEDDVIMEAACGRKVFYNDGRAGHRRHAPASTVDFSPKINSIR